MTESYTDLQKRAKAAGINSFHKSKAELEALLPPNAAQGGVAGLPVAAEPPAPEPRTQEPHSGDARAERPTERAETGRKARVPLGTARPKLAYAKRAGYVRRWFSDIGNRIHAAGEAGYTHVEEHPDGRGERVSVRVGVNEDGSPQIGFLMEIRQEFYDEDQATKQGAIDETEAAITRDIAPGDSTYRPKEGASIQVET